MIFKKQNFAIVLSLFVMTAFVWTNIPSQSVQAQAKHAHELSQAFRDAIHKVKPAVISISAERTTEPASFDNSELEQIPEFLRPFINPDLFNGEGIPEDMFRQQSWQGSGVIISKDGKAVTNYHVVKDADKLKISLDNGDEVEAKVVASDPSTDLALIQLDESKTYDFAKFGDSDALEVGDWVLAIGNPFGLSQSVSEGIVSAKGRKNSDVPVGMQEGFWFKDFIQTTAAINPGNSGGALINLDGELIGINNSIQTAGRPANLGIGFAIPSNLAEKVINDLGEYKKVRRGYLGVLLNRYESVREHFESEYGLDYGAIIDIVNPDTPAENAGFQKKDVILEVDGTKIKDNEHLISIIAQMPVGEEVEVLISRDGDQLTKKLTLAERPDESELSQLSPSQRRNSEAPLSKELLGIEVQTLTSEVAKEKGYDDGLKGVIITQIDQDASVRRADLERGDVISEIANTEISNAEDFDAALKKLRSEMEDKELESRSVLMYVHRAGARLQARYIAPTIELK